MPWVVVSGAAVVLDFLVQVDWIAELLEALIDGTFLPDGQLERRLRDEWAALLSQVDSRDEAAAAGRIDDLLAGPPAVD